EVVGMTILDLLERHLAVELLVAGDEDLAEPPLGMRPEDAEADPRGTRRADHRGAGVEVAVDVPGRGPRDADAGQASLEVDVVEHRQARAGGSDRAERREALLRVAAVGPDVLVDQGRQQGVSLARQRPTLDQEVAERSAFIDRPGAEGREERLLVDEA